MAHALILRSLGDDVLPGVIERSFPRDESLAAALEQIFGRPVDIVVFGYTYGAMVEVHDGVLLVNPGSPSLVRQKVRLGTVAILELAPARKAGWSSRIAATPVTPPRWQRGHRAPGWTRPRLVAPEEAVHLLAQPSAVGSLRSLTRAAGVLHEAMRWTLVDASRP